MPNIDQEFELEKLKKDPFLWKRLCMPLDDTGVMGNVFMEEENPFEKNPAGAMAKIQKLAAAGNLYLREKGRSRHFHKVNDDNGDLKLGEQIEMKLANRNTDPILGVLMWASSGYFKWLGFNRIAGWFDKKLERRRAINKVNDRYKEEYNSLGDDEKKQLKELRKHEKKRLKALKAHEKNLKKLEKIQQEVNKSQQELSAIDGQTTPAPQTQVQNQQTPTTQPTNTEPNAQQTPTVTQQAPTVTQQTPAQPQQTQTPPTGDKKTENTVNNTNANKIVFGNKEYTPETFNKLPPNIQKAINTIMDLIEQQEAIERQLAQQLSQLQTTNEKEMQPQNPVVTEQTPVQTKDEAVQTEPEQEVTQTKTEEAPAQTEQVVDINAQEEFIDINAIPEEETPQREGTLIDLEDFQPTVAENQTQPVSMDILQQIFPDPQPQTVIDINETKPQPTVNDTPVVDINEPVVNDTPVVDINEPVVNDTPVVDINEPVVNENTPTVDINAPLADIELEPENVDIQSRPKEQEQPTLKERLAAERQAMDVAAHWRDSFANALFSHPEAAGMMEYYQSIKNDKSGNEFLASAVCGMLNDKTASIDTKIDLVDALVNGRSIGSENNELLNNGISAFGNAMMAKNNDQGVAAGQMLANSIRALIKLAGQEIELSPNFAMYGRMIGSMAQVANERGISLPMSEKELNMANGVANTAEVARKYHKARQHLGQDGVDPMAPENRKSVRDLMLGNAIEKMIQTNLREVGSSKSVLDIMGNELWHQKLLEKYTTEALSDHPIQPDDVQTILENPNSSKAFGLGTGMVTNIVDISMEVHNDVQKKMALENAREAGQNEPEINPMQQAR